MNERQILDKTIRDAQGVIDKAKADLEALEVTYSIGDRFLRYGETKYILCGFKREGVVLVRLDTGEDHCEKMKVENVRKITNEEWNKLTCAPKSFVRYWDNAKKERC